MMFSSQEEGAASQLPPSTNLFSLSAQPSHALITMLLPQACQIIAVLLPQDQIEILVLFSAAKLSVFLSFMCMTSVFTNLGIPCCHLLASLIYLRRKQFRLCLIPACFFFFIFSNANIQADNSKSTQAPQCLPSLVLRYLSPATCWQHSQNDFRYCKN